MRIGFFGLLALILITLKLCGVVSWSWWIILLPLYFGLAFIVGAIVLFILGIFGFCGVAALIEKLKFRKKKSGK